MSIGQNILRLAVACSVWWISYNLDCESKNMSLDGDKVMLIFLVRTDIKMSKGQIAGRVADVTQYVI